MEFNSAIKRKTVTHATTQMCPKNMAQAKEVRHKRVQCGATSTETKELAKHITVTFLTKKTEDFTFPCRILTGKGHGDLWGQ